MAFDEFHNHHSGGGDGHDYDLIERVYETMLKTTLTGLVTEAHQCLFCSMWMGVYKQMMIAVINSPSEAKAMEDLQWVINLVMEEARNQEHKAWSE